MTLAPWRNVNPRAGILLDRCLKRRAPDHHETRARHDLLDVRILPIPFLDLVSRELLETCMCA